jgi:hypothetical protein
MDEWLAQNMQIDIVRIGTDAFCNVPKCPAVHIALLSFVLATERTMEVTAVGDFNVYLFQDRHEVL